MYLLRLDPAVRLGHRSTHSVLHDAIEGIRYVARHRGIGPLMLFAAAVGMMLRAVPEMLPPYVADLFGRDARGLATLASTMGFAALVGGTLVAIRGRLGGLTRIAVYAGLVMTLATACFVATHHFAIGVVCIGVMGAATTMHGISIQTLLQNSASSGHGRARAQPVGHDHPCRAGDGRADLRRRLGVPRAADPGAAGLPALLRWRGCARGRGCRASHRRWRAARRWPDPAACPRRPRATANMGRSSTMPKISRTDPGAILSKAVEYHGFVYLQGVTAKDTSKDIKGQTADVLAQIDQLLEEHGTDKTRLLQALIWVKNIRDRDGMNEVWTPWLPKNERPARACVQAELANPSILVEIMVTACK